MNSLRRLDLSRTAFDLDGVVVDIVSPFLRLLEERYGYTGFTPDHITSFDLAATLGLPESVVRAIVADLLERPLELGAQPYPGAAEVLERLCRRERLLFVTSRPRAEPMQEWFRAVLPDLPEDRIEIIATGEPEAKLDCLREYHKNCFVDDYLETCRQLDQAGLVSVVYDQPWNRSDDRLHRVNGWPELGRLFGLNPE